jgi:RNA polymerase sigma-70 factor, ECF subfamily
MARRYTSDQKMISLAILGGVELQPQAADDKAGATSEADLVGRIASLAPGQAADAEAELYRRMAPRVRLYGLRHLRDEQAAADLTQEVLLIALEALRAGRVREPDKFSSFVLGTCRMVVLDLRRNAGRRQELLNQFPRDLPVATYLPSPALDRAQLTRCLEVLPERERSVVIMSFYEEQSAVEVAQFLGLSQANVRVIRHRALGRLRECMAGRKASS